MTPHPFTAHIGRRRVVATTGGATLTGTLTPGPDGAANLLGVDLGNGTTLYVPADQVTGVSDEQDQQDRRRADGSHRLAAGLDVIEDGDWFRALCLHEAAHAVIARALAIEVTRAHGVDDRTAREGGAVSTHGGNAQHVAVYLAAGPIAHARALREMGYEHPLTGAAAEMLCGQGDHQRIAQLPGEGYVLWRRQADRDAATMLDEAPVWQAVEDVATALAAAGPEGLDRVGIDRAIGHPPILLSEHRVWSPVIDPDE